MSRNKREGIVKPDLKKMQAECDAFNAICPVGGKVRVKLDFVDELFETVTRSHAQILSGHSAVVWMFNVSGCYILDRVTPIVESSTERKQFSHTREALLAFDVGAPEREKAWNDVDCGEDVEAATAVDLAALNKVREAFYLDTQKYNDHASCMRIDIAFLRKCADVGSTAGGSDNEPGCIL